MTTLLQLRNGAFDGVISGDSVGHYMSGLMAHDWLRDSFGRNPIRYMIDYHAHLPATAIGLWPPLYYGIEALWMLVAGTSTLSVLLLSATSTSLLGLTAGLVVSRRAGRLWGLAAGLLVVGNPLVQRASNELMLDVVNGLVCLLAALVYAAYLGRGRWQAAAGFGLLAAAAMMTKYNALALVFLPPLCVVIGRRWDLLRRPSFYFPAVMVALLAGPWYVMTHGMAEQGFRFEWGLSYLEQAAIFNAGSIAEGLTPFVAVLAIVGLARVLWQGGRRGAVAVSQVELVCAALSLSVFLFLLVVPVALQDRYLIPCVAPLTVLAAYRANAIFEQLRNPVARVVWAVQIVATAVVFSWPSQPVPADDLHGVVRAAETALPAGNPVMVLIADPATEPALLATLAMSEESRPSAWVIRGSRLFGGGGYNNADYKPRFSDPRALLEEIDRYGVSLVIFERTDASRGWTHIEQFAALLAAAPDRFRLEAEIRGPIVFQILRVLGNEAHAPDAAALTQLSGPQALLKMRR